MCSRCYTRLTFILFISLNNHSSAFYTLYVSNDAGTNNTNSTGTVSEYEHYYNASNICVEPGYKKVCSGHGNCKNGVCKCDNLKSHENNTEFLYEYSGKYCEECPYCKGQRCQKLLPCVESVLRNASNNTQCGIYYNLVGNIELNYNDKLCQVEDANRCMITFKYFYDDDSNVFIDIEKEIMCLNGRKYILMCWCTFLIYIVALMIILKML